MEIGFSQHRVWLGRLRLLLVKIKSVNSAYFPHQHGWFHSYQLQNVTELKFLPVVLTDPALLTDSRQGLVYSGVKCLALWGTGRNWFKSWSSTGVQPHMSDNVLCCQPKACKSSVDWDRWIEFYFFILFTFTFTHCLLFHSFFTIKSSGDDRFCFRLLCYRLHL